MNKRFIHYDYVISGAGSVGLAMANSIKSSPILKDKNILVIEKSPMPSLKEKFNFPLSSKRIFLTNPASVSLLKNTGNWDNLRNFATQKIDSVEFWDDYSGYMKLDGEGNDGLCYMLDNNMLRDQLLKKLISYETDSPILKFNYEIDDIVTQKGIKPKLQISFSNDETVTADLLIGCDGHNSKVRKLSKIGTFEYNYDVTDHIATIQHSKSVSNFTSYKKFTEHGSIAFLSLAPGFTSLSWCVKNPYGAYLKSLSDTEFMQELNNSIKTLKNVHPWLDGLTQIRESFFSMIEPGYKSSCVERFKEFPIHIESIVKGSRDSYPLRLILANQYTKDNVVLLGDSAHRIHPITGQGLNQGLKDVIKFTKLLEKIHILGYDNNHEDLFKEYETFRKREVYAHVTFGTTIKSLFDNDNSLLRVFRSNAMHLANKFPFKNLIVNKTIA